MTAKTFPTQFAGGARYTFNIWSFLLQRPKGFVVYLNFHEPVQPVGTHVCRGSMDVQLWIRGMAYGCIGTIKADFDQKTFTFESDTDYVSFSGVIDAASLRISGTVIIKDVRNPHKITFEPFDPFEPA